MAKATKTKPEGVSTLTPYLIIKGVADAIEFYKKAFGAVEMNRLAMPDGRIMHAALKIGESTLFLCDEFPEHDCGLSPASLKTAHATMHVFVDDVDKVYKGAVAAGATGLMEPQEMFWGDRYGRLVDPFGQPWSLATHMEDLTPDEIKERMMAMGCPPAQEAAKV